MDADGNEHAGCDSDRHGDRAGASAEALPDTGSGDATRASNRTIALLIALASGAAGASIFAATGRRKRTEK